MKVFFSTSSSPAFSAASRATGHYYSAHKWQDEIKLLLYFGLSSKAVLVDTFSKISVQVRPGKQVSELLGTWSSSLQKEA